VAAVGTLGRGRDDLEDGRQRHRPGRDPGRGDGDQSAGVDPDGLLLGVILARLWRPWARSAAVGMIWKTAGSVIVLGGILAAVTEI